MKGGKKAGCSVIQIFTRNRLKWSARGLSEKEIEAFFRIRKETSVIPVSVHASYLISLSSDRMDVREKSFSLLISELEWAYRLNIPYLVIHPGSHMGLGEKKGLKIIADMFKRALDMTARCNVGMLLETTSGQGTSLGHTFNHLGEIIDLAGGSERLGICFDTCHVFSAGYDFRSRAGYRQVIDKFDNIIGLERLKLFHINDSRTGPGSRIDRHGHPGKGEIGLKPFSFFLNDPEFLNHPFILETPKGHDENGTDMDVINLKLLKNMIKNDSF